MNFILKTLTTVYFSVICVVTFEATERYLRRRRIKRRLAELNNISIRWDEVPIETQLDIMLEKHYDPS